LVVFHVALWTPVPLAGETQSGRHVLTLVHAHWWTDRPPLLQRMNKRTNTAWSAETEIMTMMKR
ncbi:hypothetical protein M9458_019331, partial [Cirrhinus mrigala]